MSSGDDIDELNARRICWRCIGEAYLSDEIKQKDDGDAPCSYCGETEPSYTIEELAERIEAAFEHHFDRTSNQPTAWQYSLMSDGESSYEWERDGLPVLDAIEQAAEIPSAAAEDVVAVLGAKHEDIEAAQMGEETEFASDSYYEEKGPNDQAWQEEWNSFERSLKTEARFFSRTAGSHLASIFGGIDQLQTSDDSPLVVEAGPQLAIDHLYRARVFQADCKLEEALCRPDLHLGPPSAVLANAGRMNARGISVFYGATESATAVAEVRPPVGSKVAVASFSIIRTLRLLDLTALEKVQDGGSIFDPTSRARMERVAFLQTLGRRMTRPVMPDDEAFDYLATQVIADFLATENEPVLEGIIFRSAQVSEGRNVVLFHKAARVEAMELPEGTELRAHSSTDTDEGPEIDYRVTEEVPSPPGALPATSDDSEWPGFPSMLQAEMHRPDPDFREATLRIDPATIEVHHVAWVHFHCTAHSVSRHRYEKHEPDF